MQGPYELKRVSVDGFLESRTQESNPLQITSQLTHFFFRQAAVMQQEGKVPAGYQNTFCEKKELMRRYLYWSSCMSPLAIIPFNTRFDASMDILRHNIFQNLYWRH